MDSLYLSNEFPQEKDNNKKMNLLKNVKKMKNIARRRQQINENASLVARNEFKFKEKRNNNEEWILAEECTSTNDKNSMLVYRVDVEFDKSNMSDLQENISNQEKNVDSKNAELKEKEIILSESDDTVGSGDKKMPTYNMNRKSDAEDSVSSSDKKLLADMNRKSDDEDTIENGSSKNLFHFLPVDKKDLFDDLELAKDNLGDLSMNILRLLSYSRDIPTQCYADYTNKVLIIRNNEDEIVKTKLSRNKDKALLVIDNALAEDVKNNLLHLDDLQYKIARGIGVKPEQIKLSYLTKLIKNVKKGYTRIQLARMLEPLITESEMSITNKTFEDIKKKPNVLELSLQDETHGFQWLGGFRNSNTGEIFQNASVQTDVRKIDYFPSHWVYFSTRSTQTNPSVKDFSQNLPKEVTTQTYRSDLYINREFDIIKTPGVFACFDDRMTEMAVITLQRHWKTYNARKKIFKKSLGEFLRYRKTKKSLLDDKICKNERINPEYWNSSIINLIYPYRRRDFSNIHWVLNRSNQNEEKKLKIKHSGPALKADLYILLEKKCKILKHIQERRFQAKSNNIENKKRDILNKFTTPTIFDSDQNKTETLVLIENSETERIRSLKELIVLYRKHDATLENRAELLVQLYQYFNSIPEFEMKDDLLTLLERECTLITSGFSEEYLGALRKRIDAIFFHLIANPKQKMLFVKHSIFKFDEIKRCKVCGKFDKLGNFPTNFSRQSLIKCLTCDQEYLIHQGKYKRPLYRDLLELTRKDEYRRGCRNPYVTIMRPEEIQHLIETIWGGRSCISAAEQISDLRVPRWDTQKPWAPWNCILLTSDEAKLHEGIEDVHEFYAEEFCINVKAKQTKAMLEFRRILKLEKCIRNRWLTKSDKEYLANVTSRVNAFNLTSDTFFHQPPRKKTYSALQ